MDELRTESGMKTLIEFKETWHSLTDEGWQFVSADITKDDWPVLVFKRPRRLESNLSLLRGH